MDFFMEWFYMDWFLTTYTTQIFAFSKRSFLETSSFITPLEAGDCIDLLVLGLFYGAKLHRS